MNLTRTSQRIYTQAQLSYLEQNGELQDEKTKLPPTGWVCGTKQIVIIG